MATFSLGYLMWQQRQFSDAAPYLFEAEAGFRKYTEMRWHELTALRYGIKSLYDGCLFEEVLPAAERFLSRARALDIRACQALGLNWLGMALAHLGREGAVERLQDAWEIAQALSDSEREEYQVQERAEFLNDLGTAARRRGRFDVAAEAFLQLIEMHRANGATTLQAIATSDIAFANSQRAKTSGPRNICDRRLTWRTRQEMRATPPDGACRRRHSTAGKFLSQPTSTPDRSSTP